MPDVQTQSAPDPSCFRPSHVQTEPGIQIVIARAHAVLQTAAQVGQQVTPGGQVVGYVFVQKLKHAESVVELVSMFRHPGKFGSPYIPFFAQYVRAVIPLACNPTQHAAARITKIHRHEAAMRPAKCAETGRRSLAARTD